MYRFICLHAILLLYLFRTNVASVGSVFNDTRKVKVLSLPETIKEKSTFRAKALRRPFLRAFSRNVDFSFIVSGSERTFTIRVSTYFVYCTDNMYLGFAGDFNIWGSALRWTSGDNSGLVVAEPWAAFSSRTFSFKGSQFFFSLLLNLLKMELFKFGLLRPSFFFVGLVSPIWCPGILFKARTMFSSSGMIFPMHFLQQKYCLSTYFALIHSSFISLKNTIT